MEKSRQVRRAEARRKAWEMVCNSKAGSWVRPKRRLLARLLAKDFNAYSSLLE